MTSRSVTIRNPAAWVVMGALADGPHHGYEMHRHLERNLGSVWRLGKSHVYALLDRLEGDGLVTHRRVSQETRPDRKRYSLTPAGRRAFTGWLGAPVRHIRDMRLEFLAKLHFASRAGPDERRRLVDEQIAVLEERLAAIDDGAEAGTATERHALAYRRTVLAATIEWLRETRRGGE